jgi:hypothetical protein
MSKVDLRTYTSKIPDAVQKAMVEFCKEDCYLIKRRKRGKTSQGARGACHKDVQRWVEKIGGERIPGWLLIRDRKTLSKGVWHWKFHSVWKTPEGEIVDVTKDEMYEGMEFSTFFFDSSRDMDFVEGTSYNNVVIFENSTSALPFSNKFKAEMKPGVVYWTHPSLNLMMDIHEHSGIYRLLFSDYTKNREMLERDLESQSTSIHIDYDFPLM